MSFDPTVCPVSVRLHWAMTCLTADIELPSDEQIIAAGREILEASKDWKKGKAYQKNTVQTYSRSKDPGDSASWYCRVSEHDASEATFDEFWGKIGINHSENEKEYVRLSEE